MTTDKAQTRIPVGSRVILKNYNWPTGFTVIGHTDDGSPIIRSDDCWFSDHEIEDFDIPITHTGKLLSEAAQNRS